MLLLATYNINAWDFNGDEVRRAIGNAESYLVDQTIRCRWIREGVACWRVEAERLDAVESLMGELWTGVRPRWWVILVR